MATPSGKRPSLPGGVSDDCVAIPGKVAYTFGQKSAIYQCLGPIEASITKMESEARQSLPLSSFIGPQTELGSVRRLLGSGARLITLTGPGGVGKTRLALEFTAQNAHAFADGVFFVPLQAQTEPEQVLEEVAGVLQPVPTPVVSSRRIVGDLLWRV